MTVTVECMLACPFHGPQFRVEKVPLAMEGHFGHRPVRLSDEVTVERATACPICDAVLQRE